MWDWFWSKDFWIHPEYSWEDYKPRDGILSPDSADLRIWPFLIMIALLIFSNCLLLPYVFTPLGKYLKIRSKPYAAPAPNDKLEKLYKVNRARPPQDLLKRTSSEVGWSERHVEKWLKQKTRSQQMTTLEKFNDFGWQFTYYMFYWIFGMIVVATEPWCYDLELAVEDYPRTSITKAFWWYYMTAIGFYYTQTFLLFTSVRRYDFYPLLSHHVCTICLLIFCWVINFARASSISLLVHECVDIPLALGKLVFYSGKTSVSDSMVFPFFFIWFSTRLVLYPFHVLRGSLFVFPRVIGTIWPAYYLLNTFMLSLLGMHLMWTKEVLVLVKGKLFTKNTLTDHRSDNEESEDDDDDEEKTK